MTPYNKKQYHSLFNMDMLVTGDPPLESSKINNETNINNNFVAVSGDIYDNLKMIKQIFENRNQFSYIISATSIPAEPKLIYLELDPTDADAAQKIQSKFKLNLVERKPKISYSLSCATRFVPKVFNKHKLGRYNQGIYKNVPCEFLGFNGNKLFIKVIPCYKVNNDLVTGKISKDQLGPPCEITVNEKKYQCRAYEGMKIYKGFNIIKVPPNTVQTWSAKLREEEKKEILDLTEIEDAKARGKEYVDVETGELGRIIFSKIAREELRKKREEASQRADFYGRMSDYGDSLIFSLERNKGERTEGDLIEQIKEKQKVFEERFDYYSRSERILENIIENLSKTSLSQEEINEGKEKTRIAIKHCMDNPTLDRELFDEVDETLALFYYDGPEQTLVKRCIQLRALIEKQDLFNEEAEMEDIDESLIERFNLGNDSDGPPMTPDSPPRLISEQWDDGTQADDEFPEKEMTPKERAYADEISRIRLKLNEYDLVQNKHGNFGIILNFHDDRATVFISTEQRKKMVKMKKIDWKLTCIKKVKDDRLSDSENKRIPIGSAISTKKGDIFKAIHEKDPYVYAIDESESAIYKMEASYVTVVADDFDALAEEEDEEEEAKEGGLRISQVASFSFIAGARIGPIHRNRSLTKPEVQLDIPPKAQMKQWMETGSLVNINGEMFFMVKVSSNVASVLAVVDGTILETIETYNIDDILPARIVEGCRVKIVAGSMMCRGTVTKVNSSTCSVIIDDLTKRDPITIPLSSATRVLDRIYCFPI